jgi:hypothetical protein
MDEQIKSDLQALARATTRGLPTTDETRRALIAAHDAKQGAIMSKIRKPLYIGAVTFAAAAAILVCPVPYAHQRGWDLALTRSDGKTIHVHLRGNDRRNAEAHAAALAHGGKVQLSPVNERVWGSVYAMAEEKLLHLDIDLRGKSDAEIQDEIESQLAAEGWSGEEVKVRRDGDSTEVRISADSVDEAGKKVRIVSESKNEGEGAADHLVVRGIAVDRTPGMTDAELKQKILDDLKARGLTGTVTVEGGSVRVEATKTIEK